jgi:hypothetical protein
LRFDLLFGVGDGVGEPFFRFVEAVGDGVGVGFFVECFRCLRLGVGLGSDSRALLIFEPNDSWAEGAASTAPNKIARIRNHFITRRCNVRCAQRRFESSSSAGCPEDSGTVQYVEIGRQDARRPHRQEVCATSARALEGLLCSNEFRLRNFRAENFR